MATRHLVRLFADAPLRALTLSGALVAAVSLTLTGCAADSGSSPAGRTGSDVTSASAATAPSTRPGAAMTSSAATPTPMTSTATSADAAASDPRVRCGRSTALPVRSATISVAGGALSAAVVGSGDRVGILLHQLDGDLCQWWPTAVDWATGSGVQLILVDLCGFGRSTCTAPAADQVAALMRFARQTQPRSVTVVGASMGGSIALATAGPVGASAVVDLSGPATWSDVADAGTAASRTQIPLLVACSATDRGVDPGALQAAVAGSPARIKVFTGTQTGHGVAMLTDLDNRPTALSHVVRDWITGRTAARP